MWMQYSRGFKRKILIIAWFLFVVLLAIGLSSALGWAQQGNPPMHQYMTAEQISKMSQTLTKLFEGKIPEDDEVVPELTLHDKIGELTCDDLECLFEKYCDDEADTDRLNHPIRERLEPR